VTTKLIIEFVVPDDLCDDRGAHTAAHDLLTGRGYLLYPMPLTTGDRFPIVSQQAGQPDPLLEFAGARYEVDT
jgi:hypothetical protein